MRWLLVGLGVAACGPGGRSEGGGITVEAPLAPDALIAYRDGDGPWTVTTGASTPFDLAIETDRYTVVIGCPSLTTRPVNAYLLARSDLETLFYDRECRQPTIPVSGSVTGLERNDVGFQVSWGRGFLWFQTFGGPQPILFETLAFAGTHDLVATRGTIDSDRLLVIRDFSIEATTTLNLDLMDPSVIELEPAQVTAGIGRLGSVTTHFFTGGGTEIPLSAGGAELPVMIVPEAAMGPNDLQMVRASQSTIASFDSLSAARVVSRRAVTSLELPPGLPQASVVATSVDPSLVLEAGWDLHPDATAYELRLSRWSIHASPTVFEESGIVMPDLSAVPEWDQSLWLLGGPGLEWFAASHLGAPLEDVLRTFPTREMTVKTSGFAGVLQ